MSVLAIDQGTTSTRALAVDPDGNARIVSAHKHRQYYPRAGWVEHDPEELLAGIRAGLDAAEVVSAVGIDNQGESCLAWHADTGEPLGPVIVWQDNRTSDVIERLRADGAEAEVLARSGLPLDSYFSASKLAWQLKNLPDAADLLAKGELRLGTTDAWFLHKLTGRCVTDVTTASRTSLMHLETGQWDPVLCELFGVPMVALPEIVPTTGDLGSVKAGTRDIPITASVVDQQAALYGHGCRAPGDVKITFGTGAFALLVTGTEPLRAPEKGLLPTVAWQHAGESPVYALDGGVYSAGSAIDWARGLGLFNHYEDINAFNGPAAIDRGLAFVPALTGLACPHWDRDAAGIWIGLSLETGREDMVRALLEGVAFRAAEVIRAMSSLTTIGDTVSIDGGVSVNPYFCQFLADAMGRTVVVQGSPELTAIGTARLAGAAELRPGKGEIPRSYMPTRDMTSQVERFGEAVRRAGAWRRPSDEQKSLNSADYDPL